MVHIEEDSLNGDADSIPQNAIVPPTYENEKSPRMQLKYDKFRPKTQTSTNLTMRGRSCRLKSLSLCSMINFIMLTRD
jgi:hypothetical protein